MRAAVVGVGHLGQHHARILASLPGVSLAGVVDLNRERAAKIAGDYGTTAFGDVAEIPGSISR
jgi:predicted dehydrogenase